MTTGLTTSHTLPGLRPEPLASYLAGLGLIRVVGERADPDVTATWTSDGLVVTTKVSDLAAWLADEYVPTPILSPWNNGSGFGRKDKEPLRVLNLLREHPSPRLGAFRDAIALGEKVVREARDKGWISDTPGGGQKNRVVKEFRNRCPDELLAWIDAAIVLAGEDTFFPPLLGTGGNDGRLDFSTNFHQRLLEVIDQPNSLALAKDLLAGTEEQQLARAAVGQFDPAAAGGPGSSRFGAADSLVNPWGYILFVEGALLFAASAVRRNQFGAGRAAMPFTVIGSPDGSDSGASGEESRGEVWTPLWQRPLSIAEIRQLFAEARASWRGKPARRSVDFYAATRTLGVARGIDAFTRYGLQRRNGLAFAAVPLAHVKVREHAEVRLAADVEDWAGRFARDASGAVGEAVRRFQAAHLAYARDGSPLRLAQMLAELTSLEHAVGRSGRSRESAPVRYAPPATAFIAELAKQPSPELRVAAGLASCATLPGPDPATNPRRTMRQLLLPVDPGDNKQPNGRWRDSPVIPGFGTRPLPRVLADVLVWRCRTAPAERDAGNYRGVPAFRNGVAVPTADLHAFAAKRLDMDLLSMYLRACLALNWRNTPSSWDQTTAIVPVATLALLQPFAGGLRLGNGEDEPMLALNPDWAIRLTAGYVEPVHEEASLRLRRSGWEHVVPAPPGLKRSDGVMIAAALVPRCLGSRDALSKVAANERQSPNSKEHS
jgi:CRISPR-associated protein Csx17